MYIDADSRPELPKEWQRNFGKDPAPRIVPRDLFPLPPFGGPTSGFSRRSRRGAQRAGREQVLMRVAEDVRSSPNLLCTSHAKPSGVAEAERANAAQRACMQDIVLRVSEDEPTAAEDRLPPEAALEQLLGSRSGYAPGPPASLASFEAGKVALPSTAGKVSLLEVVELSSRSLLEAEGPLLCESADVCLQNGGDGLNSSSTTCKKG